MPLEIASRHLRPDTIKKRYGDALVLDLTSKAALPWLRFSPFYPLGGIPVPFSPGYFGMSVEGIWQGLKVFESADIDEAKLYNTSMKRLKRTVRRFGRCLGHREGLKGERLLGYLQARRRIYLPCYRWALEHKLGAELNELRALSEDRRVILLDYETNEDIEDLSKPLSHAGLVRRWIEERWPEEAA